LLNNWNYEICRRTAIRGYFSCKPPNGVDISASVKGDSSEIVYCPLDSINAAGLAIQYPYEYDLEKRRLAKSYTKQKIVQAFIIGAIVPLVFFLSIGFLGLSIPIRNFAFNLLDSLHILIYLSFLFGMLLLTLAPFSFYFGYVFEHKYGLSSQKVSEWLKDFIKTRGLLNILLVPAGMGLHLIWINFPYHWWIIVSSCFFLILLLITTIFPVLFVPFFWKTEGYTNKARTRRLLEVARKAGVNAVEKVQIVKESEKSKKVNAAVIGLGRTRRILIFDNLVNNFTSDEIDVIFAHEMGHHANMDITRGILFSTILAFPAFFVISIIIMPLANLAGVESLNDIAIFPVFAALFILIGMFIKPIYMAYSRTRERLADQFALEVVRNPGAQISAFKRLADIDLEDDSPYPFVEVWLYSHPSISRRIRFCETWKAQ
jgi:STE24 endopeptidase